MADNEGIHGVYSKTNSIKLSEEAAVKLSDAMPNDNTAPIIISFATRPNIKQAMTIALSNPKGIKNGSKSRVTLVRIEKYSNVYNMVAATSTPPVILFINSKMLLKIEIKSFLKVILLNRGSFTTDKPPKISPMVIDSKYKNTTPNTDQPSITVQRNTKTGSFALHGMKVKNLIFCFNSFLGVVGSRELIARVVQPNPSVKSLSLKSETTVNKITTCGKNDINAEITGHIPSVIKPLKKSNTFNYII